MRYIAATQLRVQHVRISGAMFHNVTGKSLGALLVLNDLTTIKKLEKQVRRTDRLASLGTLSAGMAPWYSGQRPATRRYPRLRERAGRWRCRL